MEVLHIENKEQFETEILNSEKRCLVDFWAEWCMPCQMLTPIINQLAEETTADVVIAKVNVDECQDIAIKYNVQSIPTILLFENGKAVQRVVGVQPKTALEQMLQGK